MPWALKLHKRCTHYSVLPGSGGAYDQDEYLMTAMEQAAGIDRLFDADGATILASQERLDLHTQLETEAAEIVAAVNAREQVANDQS